MAISDLFGDGLKVVNIGLESFAESIRRAGGESVHVDWRPPADLDPAATERVRARAETIREANDRAVKVFLAGAPFLVGMGKAVDVVPGMRKDLLLHAGPPVTWDRMCGPMRGAVMGALIYEGMAASPGEAEKLAASGAISFDPCHEHGAVGPMAGVVSASMPVFILRNETSGNLAFTTQNEGLGKVLRYGAYSEEVIRRLKWMEDTLYPTLKRAIEHLGKIDLKAVIAQALHMGDEVHNRNRAATSLLYRALAPAVVRTAPDPEIAAAVLDFIGGNDHFFLNLSMATCKALLDPLAGIPGCSLVTVMARNGTDFGVKVSGTGPRWFTGPAPVPDALYFPGFSKADANPDIGDSAITETGSLGGFAIAAAPAIVQFVGGDAADAAGYTLQMYEITAAEHNAWQIPTLNFRGTPVGIDVIKVATTGVLPFIDTGVAHKDPGVGQVGAGVLSAPMEPFRKAFEAFGEALGG
ncbi:MAG: DUF1116 domain-containing protein [Acidobacteria bacterium]|nr:DUF1116 domain-containing protein [Acidobacteriota bacterium]